MRNAFIAGVFVLLAGTIYAWAQEKPAAPPVKWEYRIELVNRSEDDGLNAVGNDGWELVSVVSEPANRGRSARSSATPLYETRAYFKRQARN